MFILYARSKDVLNRVLLIHFKGRSLASRIPRNVNLTDAQRVRQDVQRGSVVLRPGTPEPWPADCQGIVYSPLSTSTTCTRTTLRVYASSAWTTGSDQARVSRRGSLSADPTTFARRTRVNIYTLIKHTIYKHTVYKHMVRTHINLEIVSGR